MALLYCGNPEKVPHKRAELASKTYKRAWEIHEEVKENIVMPKFIAGELTSTEADQLDWHLTNTRLAKETKGLTYIRIPVKGAE